MENLYYIPIYSSIRCATSHFQSQAIQMLGLSHDHNWLRFIFKEQRLHIVYMNKKVDSQKKNIQYFVVKLNLEMQALS